MQFIVRSGKYEETIEAIDFNQAARLFLEVLVNKEEEISLGNVISVSCAVTEAFIDTDNAWGEINSRPFLRFAD